MIVDAEQRTKRLMRAPEARITASSEEMMMTPTHYPVAWPSLGPWMRDLGWDAVQIELFDRSDDGDDLVVGTHWCGTRRVLSKSQRMCERYTDLINETRSTLLDTEARGGAARIDRARLDGIIYVMYTSDGIRYVGKAARSGTRQPISANMNPNPHHQFGRWGCGPDWHLGGLSNWLFTGRGNSNERNWPEALFRQNDPPALRKNIFFWASQWPLVRVCGKCPCGHEVGLAELEYCLIASCRAVFPELLLNKEHGRQLSSIHEP